MKNVTFIKAVLRKAEIKGNGDGAYVQIHFSAAYSEDVMKKLGWKDPGESVKKAEMTGPDSLPGGNLILTPEPEALVKSQIQFPFGGADSFHLITIEKKESKRREFRFCVTTISKEAANLSFDYKAAMMDTVGTLKLAYQAQEELPIQ